MPSFRKKNATGHVGSDPFGEKASCTPMEAHKSFRGLWETLTYVKKVTPSFGGTLELI